MKESKSFSVALFTVVQEGRISRDDCNYTLGDLSLKEAKEAAVECVRRGMYADACVYRTGEADYRFRHYCTPVSVGCAVVWSPGEELKEFFEECDEMLEDIITRHLFPAHEAGRLS